MKLNKPCFYLLSLLVLSCQSNSDLYDLKTWSGPGQLNAVIEIPAGTNLKMEFNPDSGDFKPDQKNNADRVVEFLPYIGNYGFIPSTRSVLEEGGDGDALDILVLSETVSTGTVIKVKPIAVLQLLDDGEQDDKIIAVPVDVKHKIIDAETFEELSNEYKPILDIIEIWFSNYNRDDITTIKGWKDESVAVSVIEKAMK